RAGAHRRQRRAPPPGGQVMRSVIRWCQVQWDRALAIALTVLGAIALIIGWIGISGALVPSQQLPYIISGGIGSLFILGVAAALGTLTLLMNARRSVTQRSRALAEEMATR